MTDRRPHVVYWGSQPSPYVVERLDAVVASGQVDLEAWFDYEREADRSWRVEPETWSFPARYLTTTGARPRVPWRELAASRPDLIVTLYDRPHAFLGMLVARAVAGRVTVRCLPPVAVQSGRRTWVHDVARRVVFRVIDGAKVPGPDGRAFAAANGLGPSRTWVVTQSVDIDRYGRAAEMTPARRQQLRDGWGAGGCTFLYVGRLVREKGVHDLLAAYARVSAENPDVALLLAGDGADEAELRAAAATLPRVAFIGFLQPEQLPDAYAAADVVVFPTLGDPHGLVVQESMAAGRPVIATTAAHDVAVRIDDGTSGFVVAPGDVDALADRMARLAGAPELRASMGAAARARAEGFRHTRYAADFDEFAAAVTAMPARATALARLVRLAGRAAGPLARVVGERAPR